MAHSPDPIESSAVRNVAVRLVPFVAPMFFINYLERTAISFVGPITVTACAIFAGMPDFWILMLLSAALMVAVGRTARPGTADPTSDDVLEKNT